MDYCYYIYYFKSDSQGRETVKVLYQSKDPIPTQPTQGREKKQKIVKDKKRAEFCQQNSIGSALKTFYCHTIEHKDIGILI